MNAIDFQCLFEAIPGLHVVLSPDFKIVAASDGYIAATRKQREEILGRVFFEIFPDNPEDVKNNAGYSLQGALQTVLNQKKILNTPLRKYKVQKSDGTFETKYWSSEDKPLLDDKNEVRYILHSVTEITDLIRSEQLFSSVFEYNPACIALSRMSNGEIINVNQALLTLFDFPSKEAIIGKRSAELNVAMDDSGRDEIVSKLSNGEKVVEVEGQIRQVSGAVRWISCSIQVVDINNEKCMLSTMLDITQKKEGEALRQVQSAQLKQANEELETFSYSVSHDLKAPLRSLEGFSKLLLENYKGKFDADADRWLNFIAENANRMGILINDILNFSRISRSNLNTVSFSMQQIVEELFNNEKNNYPGKSIELHIGQLENAEGDRAMLVQVWQNLISNALKYSSKNEHISVTIDCKKEEDFTVYSIKDNGVGFDEKYKDKLFGVFQRLHRSEEFEGTGVGLAIVNRIIQKHDGWVRVSSTLGKGTEFVFAIPSLKHH
ncbi:MAG: PAS domain-containing protein [Cytophagaceae bacterium]|nr:PAS domain-containing protein [Cytophagaceae bacterium]